MEDIQCQCQKIGSLVFFAPKKNLLSSSSACRRGRVWGNVRAWGAVREAKGGCNNGRGSRGPPGTRRRSSSRWG